MLTVSLLVCAMMALTRANGDEDTSINGTLPVIKDHSNTSFLTQAGSACSGDWKEYNNRCFLFVPLQRTWAQAQINCLSKKATLASIHSQEEHSFVQGLTTNMLPAWIGGSDCQEATAWFWTDSTIVSFNSWCAGQPDNTPDQCCLQMNTGGAKCWDDLPCQKPLPSVCVQTK